jgi:hypothetical protein
MEPEVEPGKCAYSSPVKELPEIHFSDIIMPGVCVKKAGMAFQRTAFAAVFIFLLAACDYSIGFLNGNYADQYYTLSLNARSGTDSPGTPVEAGATLAPGAEFTISIDSQAGSPVFTVVSVSLVSGGSPTAQALFALEGAPESRAADIQATAKTLVPALSGTALPVLVPAEITQGPYLLRVELYGEADRVYEKELEVFISSEVLSIGSIQVSPASVEPEAVAVLRAQLELSGSLDPYLVWTYDGETLDEGLLSAGHGNALWKAPADEGVYSVSVDAYPYPPPSGIHFDFAGKRLSARVVVRAPSNDPSNPFLPQSDFYAQFRFNGSLADTGTRAFKAPVETTGSPGIFVYGAGYGVRFDASSSLSSAEYLLPVKAGALQPFSLMSRILLLPAGADDELPVALIASSGSGKGSPGSVATAVIARRVFAEEAAAVGDGSASPEPAENPGPSVESVSAPETALASPDPSPAPADGPSPSPGSAAADSAITPTAAPAVAATLAALASPGPAPGGASGSVLRIESSLPGFSLVLGIDQDGQYILSVANRREKVVFESGIYPDERVHDLVVSVVPDARGLYVSWFWDYADIGSYYKEIDLGEISPNGRATFGGDGAASVVIDEFGVYSRERDGLREPWTGAFATMMRRSSRRGLVYAEGFDGVSIPGVAVSGEASMDRGVLLLGSKSRMAIPFPSDMRGTYDLEISFRVMADSLRNREFSLVGISGGLEAFRVDQDGAFSLGGGESGRLAGLLNGQSLRLRVGKASRGYYVMNGGQRIYLPADREAILEFALSSGKSILPVEAILITSKDDPSSNS